MESVTQEQSLSRCVQEYRTVRYNRVLAWLEGFLV